MAYTSSAIELPYAKRPMQGGSPIRSVYDAAASQQAENYDDIYGGYDSLQKRAITGQNPVTFNPVNPIARNPTQGSQYSRSDDFGRLVENLQNFSSTGGYSDSDIGNIRERAVSPLRAVYANAQRNMERQKVLQGGYMPNMGAVTSKMAREQGELQSNANIGINAEVARMVQSGKLSGMNALSPLVNQENSLSNQINQRNVDAQREVDLSNVEEERNVRNLNTQGNMRAQEFNANQNQQDTGMELNALQGKQSLYGTTPALTNMFGNQVLQNNQQNMQAIQTANQIKNQRAGIGLNIVGSAQSGAIGNQPRRLG